MAPLAVVEERGRLAVEGHLGEGQQRRGRERLGVANKGRLVHLVHLAPNPRRQERSGLPPVSNIEIPIPSQFDQSLKANATTGTYDTVAPVTTGSSNPPYSVLNEKDGNSNYQYQSITCLPAYRGTSFEVRRMSLFV